MDACIVDVTGGELPAEEIEAYKRRALDLYGRMPYRIEIRVVGEEVELKHHFTYRPVVYRGIRSTLEIFDDLGPADLPPLLGGGHLLAGIGLENFGEDGERISLTLVVVGGVRAALVRFLCTEHGRRWTSEPSV